MEFSPHTIPGGRLDQGIRGCPRESKRALQRIPAQKELPALLEGSSQELQIPAGFPTSWLALRPSPSQNQPLLPLSVCWIELRPEERSREAFVTGFKSLLCWERLCCHHGHPNRENGSRIKSQPIFPAVIDERGCCRSWRFLLYKTGAFCCRALFAMLAFGDQTSQDF